MAKSDCRPRIPPKPPRKSNTNTPVPGADSDPNQLTLAERLSVHDLPKPFKNPYFVSRLSQRTATASSTQVKKNVKQILTLERERLSGGDGFLTAAQAAAKARGEPIDLSKKKKNPTGKQRGNIANLRRGKQPGPGTATGTATPVTEITESGRTTPVDEDEEEDDTPVPPMEAPIQPADGLPRKEIITYHTPTAPPSLLPAKKYCDITGLHAAYTDPRTKLRYKGLDVWHVVRGLGPGGDQAYLALRNAQTSLK